LLAALLSPARSRGVPGRERRVPGPGESAQRGRQDSPLGPFSAQMQFRFL